MARNNKLTGIVLLIVAILFGSVGMSPAYAQDTNSGCLPGYNENAYQWSSAGPAPCDEDVLVSELQAESAAPGSTELFVTIVNGNPGEPTPVGWVLATSGTEAVGSQFVARHVPAGVTVDFDPGASELYGDYEYVDFTDMWRRATLTSDGAFRGLKGTFYWTPGDLSGAERQTESVDIPQDLQSTGASQNQQAPAQSQTGTPASSQSQQGQQSREALSPETAAKLFESAGPPLNDASNWTMVDGSTTQVKYGPGEAVGEFQVPDGYSVDYDAALGGDGRAEAGESVPAGAIVFTLNESGS